MSNNKKVDIYTVGDLPNVIGEARFNCEQCGKEGAFMYNYFLDFKGTFNWLCPECGKKHKVEIKEDKMSVSEYSGLFGSLFSCLAYGAILLPSLILIKIFFYKDYFGVNSLEQVIFLLLFGLICGLVLGFIWFILVCVIGGKRY
ncbi:MAG: hypothetical protein LBG67_03875 [Campylobacteraceae bacterium]|jgi:transcription elongation factor Elf1|nr:hypothetical protein [Campylobacteraceae bacterium]